MIEKDTVRLLRECSAGIDMGVASIDEVLPYAGDETLRRSLQRSRKTHIPERCGNEDAVRTGNGFGGLQGPSGNLSPATPGKKVRSERDNAFQFRKVITDGLIARRQRSYDGLCDPERPRVPLTNAGINDNEFTHSF